MLRRKSSALIERVALALRGRELVKAAAAVAKLDVETLAHGARRTGFAEALLIVSQQALAIQADGASAEALDTLDDLTAELDRYYDREYPLPDDESAPAGSA